MESLFVKCHCSCNVVEFEFDDLDNDDIQFNISMWSNHYGLKPLSKKERIRWCDHVMKTGNPWADHTIVTKKDAQRIVQFLTKHINGKTKSRKRGRIS